MKQSRLPAVLTALVLAFLWLPILYLVWNSFNASRYSAGWEGFSLRWYEGLFSSRSRDLWEAAQRSVGIAAVSSVAAMVLGTLSAWALHRFRESRLQRAHYGLIYLPIVIPDLLMGISLLLFFVAIGVSLGVGTIVIAHITFCTSFVTVVVLGRLQGFDDSVVHAARDLGATRWQVVWRVIFPMLRPGIIAGGLLAFTLSIDDFVVTFFVSGPGSTTLPLKIYSMVKHSRELPIINALSTLLITLTFFTVWWSQKLTTHK